MRPHGWQGSFPHCPVIAQTTLGSVKIRLLLNEGDRFCVLWNQTWLQSFNVFYGFKVFVFFKINAYTFIPFKLFVF
jgi:hypothetical protein